jgi:hypothetical protein
MSNLSRRSILFAPVAIAAAGIAPKPKRNPLRAIFGRLQSSAGKLRPVKWDLVDPQPFELLSEVRIGATSLDGAARLPEIGDQANCALADGGLRVAERSAADECAVGHSSDLGDQGADGMVRLVGVVDEQIDDQSAQQQARAGELDSDRVDDFLGTGRHVSIPSFGAARSPRGVIVLAHLAILALLAFAVAIGAPR